MNASPPAEAAVLFRIAPCNPPARRDQCSM